MIKIKQHHTFQNQNASTFQFKDHPYFCLFPLISANIKSLSKIYLSNDSFPVFEGLVS